MGAIDCDQYGNPWKDNRPCGVYREYINQDYKKRKERFINDNNIQPAEWPKMGTVESILKIFFLEQKPKPEIAKQLNITLRYVNKVIKQYKPIIASNIRKSCQK